MGEDQYHHSNDERVSPSDLKRIAQVSGKAWGRDTIGWMLSDMLGFASGDWPALGVIGNSFAFNATGGDKVVRIAPGVGINADAAVTDAWLNPVQFPRVEAPYTSTLADEAGGQEKWYLYSIPGVLASLGITADVEVADYNAAGSTDITQMNTTKRLSWATSITETAGVAAAIGAATVPSVPAGHIPLWAVRKEAATNLSLFPPTPYAVPLPTTNARDRRIRCGWTLPLRTNEQDGSVVPAGRGNQLSRLGVAAAGALLVGTGASAPNVNESHSVLSVARNGVGDYTLTFTKAFSASTRASFTYGIEVADLTVYGTFPTASTFRVRVRSLTPGAHEMAAGEILHLKFYGEQVA